jgi:hypothetical protein
MSTKKDKRKNITKRTVKRNTDVNNVKTMLNNEINRWSSELAIIKHECNKLENELRFVEALEYQRGELYCYEFIKALKQIRKHLV